MSKKIVCIVAPTNFRDEELLEPKKVFESRGHRVLIASKNTKEAIGMLGGKASIDIDVSRINSIDYDAYIFIGGSGSIIYFNDKLVHRLINDIHQKNKLIGAICIAPTILANAGILQGKKATSSSSEEKTLTEKGASFTGENVTIDGNIITADGPLSARVFGEKIVELLDKS